MAGNTEGFHAHVPKELSRYLISTESIVFLVHRHWIILVEPIFTVIIGIGVVILASSKTPDILSKIVFAIWLLLLFRLAFRVFEWHHEIFIATTSRLMLVHGLLTRQVDIMPMTKVTDMRYDRSLIGQIFGYGVFVLETAGQEQALSRINFIPNPDLHYQQISAVIFAPTRRPPHRTGTTRPGSRAPIPASNRSWWRRA